MNGFLKYIPVLIISFLQLVVTTPVLKSETKAYVVGVVPQFSPRKIQEIWQPILNVLSKKLNLVFSLSQSKSIPVFEKQFSDGDFDIAYMNPYHLIVANKQEGYTPLVRDIKRKLFGIIVVRKDSPFQSIRDLEGQTIAFPAPNALGAALIPRAEFAKKYKINIIPIYVRSHTSVYLNVILKKASAGGGVQKTLSQQKTDIRDHLRILYRTASVAPHPITIHPRVPSQDRIKILEVFLMLGSTVEGRSMLNKIPIKQIGEAKLQDYKKLMEMGLEEFYIK
jgi:phosphonate transport system substrate-binding protein